MASPQTGIFALGDSAHAFLEFALAPGVEPAVAVREVARIHEPRTTVGGANFVVAFRPELWRAIDPAGLPGDLTGFERPLTGVDGYAMPASQADAWLWISGASYDVAFDLAQDAIDALRGIATLEREASGWSYRHSRDLTGFEDGTENPTLLDAPGIALIGDGQPGESGSVLLFQKWRHRTDAWRALPDADQERVMGRTKADSLEFPPPTMPPSAHVARTKISDAEGNEQPIFRRNVPYGTVSDHGTLFIGFSCERARLERMLRRMAGAEDGVRDALTFYSEPLTGAYYFVPSTDQLRRFAAED